MLFFLPHLIIAKEISSNVLHIRHDCRCPSKWKDFPVSCWHAAFTPFRQSFGVGSGLQRQTVSNKELIAKYVERHGRENTHLPNEFLNTPPYLARSQSASVYTACEIWFPVHFRVLLPLWRRYLSFTHACFCCFWPPSNVVHYCIWQRWLTNTWWLRNKCRKHEKWALRKMSSRPQLKLMVSFVVFFSVWTFVI